MEAEMRMNHALACAAHFLPGAVVFIIFRPNPIHSGEGVIYCLSQTPLAQKKWRYTAEQKCQYTKSQPNPIFLPPSPLLGGAAVGILKEGLQPARQGWGVFSHYLAPSQTLLALFFLPTLFLLRCISFNNVHRSPSFPSYPFLSLSPSLSPRRSLVFLSRSHPPSRPPEPSSPLSLSPTLLLFYWPYNSSECSLLNRPPRGEEASSLPSVCLPCFALPPPPRGTDGKKFNGEKKALQGSS